MTKPDLSILPFRFPLRHAGLLAALPAALLLAAVPAQSLRAEEAATAGEAPANPAEGKTGGQFSEANMQFDFALGLLRRGLAKEAAAEFTKFLTAYPDSPRRNDALLHRAEGYFSAGNFKAAGQDYYRYLTATRTAETGPRLRYGICLYELQDYKGALQLLTSLTQGADDNAQSALYYAALCRQKLGQGQQALEDLQRVSGTSFRPLALYALAEAYLDRQDYQKAAEFFQQMIRDYPAHALAAKARLARANALRLAGKLEESGEDFQNLLTSDDPAVRLRAQYGLAWTQYGNNKPGEAAELAKKILAAPQGAEFFSGAHFLLGSIAFAAKDFAAADTEFSQVTDGDFAPRAALARGWALYELKKYPDALRQTQESAKQFITFPQDEFSYLAGRCLLELKQFPQAAQALLTAREVKGARHERAAFELGLAQEQAKNLPAAAEALDYFIRAFPASRLVNDATVALGRTLMATGRYEAAVPVYAAFLELQNLPAQLREHALERQAVCYYYLKQYDNMARVYEKVLQNFPQNLSAAEALFWLAWFDSSQKKYLPAAARYEDLLKRFPQSPLAPKARYYLGSSYLHGGQEDKAADIFFALALQAADKTNPGMSGGPALEGRELLWLAQHYADRKDTLRAQKVYGLLLSGEKPGLVRAVALRGQGEAGRQTKDWKGALDNYDALLKLLKEIEGQPHMIAALRNDALYGAGVCLRESGKFADARKMLDQIRAAADDPFLAKVYLERGLLEFATENYAKAAESLMRVGLLVDDEELAGQALVKAGEACEKAGDPDKAQICWDELAGKLEGSYGKLHPDNKYTAIGKEKQKQLNQRKP